MVVIVCTAFMTVYRNKINQITCDVQSCKRSTMSHDVIYDSKLNLL